LVTRPGLDAAATDGFAEAVSKLVKYSMIAAMFVVALLGGSDLPILHAPQFAEAHAFAHEHMDASISEHAVGDELSQAAHDHDHTQPPGSDHGCTHVHAHCCASTAILATELFAPPNAEPGHMRLARNGALPYGQLSYPLLRPPRLTA
jgi:hypothetical protein